MKLLVSVRNQAEVELALAGGAQLIDVKEPARGALGRADWDQIGAIHAGMLECQHYAGQPFSVAFGELTDWDDSSEVPLADWQRLRPDYFKLGLAGAARLDDWKSRWQNVTTSYATASCPVLVAYADWQLAQSPPPMDVLQFASEAGVSNLLVDTFTKTGRRLFDFLSSAELTTLRHRCHDQGIELALAGSLRFSDLNQLQQLLPDWVAVRGAVCEGERTSQICPNKVAMFLRGVSLVLPGSGNSS